MPITALPTPPNRADAPEIFAQRADDFLSALPDFATETNAVAAEVQANAAICQSAAMVVDVTAWVSGTTYAVGNARYDPTDFLTYRRKVAGAGTTRPGLDPTNWQLLTGFGDVSLAAEQVFTGKKSFTGFTALGSGAPALRCKKLTGTTASAENTSIDIAHGVADFAKVVSVSVMVYDSFNAAWIHAGHTASSERQFDWRLTASAVRIINSATNSGSILSAPVKVLLWIEE